MKKINILLALLIVFSGCGKNSETVNAVAEEITTVPTAEGYETDALMTGGHQFYGWLTAAEDTTIFYSANENSSIQGVFLKGDVMPVYNLLKDTDGLIWYCTSNYGNAWVHDDNKILTFQTVIPETETSLKIYQGNDFCLFGLKYPSDISSDYHSVTFYVYSDGQLLVYLTATSYILFSGYYSEIEENTYAYYGEKTEILCEDECELPTPDYTKTDPSGYIVVENDYSISIKARDNEPYCGSDPADNCLYLEILKK